MQRFLLQGCSILCLTGLLGMHPAFADDLLSDDLSPRAEVSVKGGSERSILTTEFWAPLAQSSGKVFYGDLRLMGDDDDNREGNLGIGYRQIVESTDSILGGHLWIDRRRTEHNSTFHQITIGAESLGNVIDLRANGYIPLNGANTVTTPNLGSTTPYLAGSGVYYDTNGSVSETPQYGADAEIGYRIPILRGYADTIRVYGGGYSFFRSGTDNVTGYRIRTEAVINSIFSVGARFQHDAPRGDQGFLEATIRFPFSAKKLYQTKGLYGRLDESPERDVDIVTSSKTTSGLAQPLLNASGTQQRILYVDNTKTNGDGTKENPFNNLISAQTALQANDILYIASGNGTTSGMDQGLTIAQNNVRLVGSGSALTISGYTFLAAGQAPIITNTQTAVDDFTGNGITVTAANPDISGIIIDGPKQIGIHVIATTGQSFDYVNIHDSVIRNVAVRGVWVRAQNGGSINTVSITNNTAINNGNDGMAISALAANGGTIGGHIGTAIFMNNVSTTNGTNNLRFSSTTGSMIDNAIAINNTTNSARTGSGILVNAGVNATIGNLTISNLTTNNNSTSGINILLTSNSTLGNVDISNVTTNSSGADNILLSADTGSRINNASLHEITTSASQISGIYVIANSASIISTVSLANITSFNNTVQGINIIAFNGSTIGQDTLTNIIANNNAQNGIYINAQNSSTIGSTNVSGVTANANKQSGVRYWLQTNSIGGNVTISNNNTADNLTEGLYVAALSGSVVDSVAFQNNIIVNSRQGISVLASGSSSKITNLNIAGISSTNNSQFGVVVNASAGMISNATLSNITANNNTSHGVYVLASSAGTLNNASLSNITANNNKQFGVDIESNASGNINNITATTVTANSNLSSGVQVFANAGNINAAQLSYVIANNNAVNGIYFNNVGSGILNNTSLSYSDAINNTTNGVVVVKTGTTYLVDLGGGALNSAGQNRIYGNGSVDLIVNGGYALVAKNNWWGVNTGLAVGRRTLNGGSTVDSSAFLTTDPRP